MVVVLTVLITMLVVGLLVAMSLPEYHPLIGWQANWVGCLITAVGLFGLVIIGCMYLGKWLL